MNIVGTFDEWMADTETLINMIVELGDGKWDVRDYTSPYFSISYNSHNWTFKYGRVLDPMEELNISGSGLHTLGSNNNPNSYHKIGYHNIGYQPQGISNSTRTQRGSNHVNIVLGGVNNNCIKSIQWIRKPNSNLVITNTSDSTFETMAGGIVRASMLFLPNMKILVNDKIYSHETSEAFTQDISSDNPPFRYLDLLAFREKYDGQLY